METRLPRLKSATPPRFTQWVLDWVLKSTSKASNVLVLGAIVTGAVSTVAAPTALGLGLNWALEPSDWAPRLFIVSLLYGTLWWIGSAAEAWVLPAYGRIEQQAQSAIMVDALARSGRRDPRDRRRQDAPSIGFAIDALAAAFRDGLNVLYLSLIPAAVGILAGMIAISLIGGIWVTLIFVMTFACYWWISNPLIRKHEERQKMFFTETLRSHGVLVNSLELWRETFVYRSGDYIEDRYRLDRRDVEGKALHSYQATRTLQVSQAGVLAGGIACALLALLLSGVMPQPGTAVAVVGVFMSASLPLQAAGFGMSTLAVASARQCEADEQIGSNSAIESASRVAILPPMTGRPVWCLGVSGAGKTTWVERILGLREYEDGQTSAPCEHAAYLPQDPHLMFLTASGNVAFGRPLSDEAINSALDAVGLTQFVNGGDRAEEIISPESTGLSGGELRRVALARALADPDVSLVVLDEPTAGLDEGMRSVVWKLIEVHAKNRIVIVATHDPQAPIRPGDLILRPGPDTQVGGSSSPHASEKQLDG